MPNWRDELIDAVKTKAEREAEEVAKHQQRVQEALASAEAALVLAAEGLRFGHERINEKGQQSTFADERTEGDGSPLKMARLGLGTLNLTVELDRTTAVIKVSFLEGKPREFDFARDRHIAAADVEEYVGRRVVELVRSAQKAAPW